MFGHLGAVPEHTGCLDDHVDAQLGPREGSGVLLGEQLHPLASGEKVGVDHLDRSGELAHHRVVLEEVRLHLLGGEIVESGDLDGGVALGDHPEHRPADPSEPIDGDPHGLSPSKVARIPMTSTTRAA